jgi:hypothetical protein
MRDTFLASFAALSVSAASAATAATMTYYSNDTNDLFDSAFSTATRNMQLVDDFSTADFASPLYRGMGAGGPIEGPHIVDLARGRLGNVTGADTVGVRSSVNASEGDNGPTTIFFSGFHQAISFTLGSLGATSEEDLTITLSNGASIDLTGDVSTDPDNVVRFVGLTSDMAFNSITFEDTVGGRGAQVNIDNLAVGGLAPVDTLPVVPLPASLPLLLGALGVAGWASRRKRPAA